MDYGEKTFSQYYHFCYMQQLLFQISQGKMVMVHFTGEVDKFIMISYGIFQDSVHQEWLKSADF